MNYCKLFTLLLTSLLLLSSCTTLDTPLGENSRTRESLNKGWRFARFGVMSDGSQLAEPGVETPLITVSASSEEVGKSNFAKNALDGKQGTRWCAANDKKGQWLKLDLKAVPSLSSIEIDWEEDKAYQYMVESSVDGKFWEIIADRSMNTKVDTERIKLQKSNFLRIRTTGLPKGRWASINEIRLFDKDDALIINGTIRGGKSPSEVNFDDSAWRSLNVPHDWGIEGPFRQELPGWTGKLPWVGIGWYRKKLAISESDRGKRIFVDFDGAMSDSTIYLNGKKVGAWPYGYASFRVELTDEINYGSDNVLAVRLDNKPQSSRWYPGAGIYRNVWLVKVAPIHVANWGAFMTTPKVSKESASLNLQVTLENRSSVDATISLSTSIYRLADDGQAKVQKIGELKAISIKIEANGSATTRQKGVILNPQLWDLENPNLYSSVTLVMQNRKVIDCYETQFGIRTIEYKADTGFLLNGKVVELNGVCQHHDLGPLGTAINVRALERQIEILQEMGCNSIRTSHNPPAPEFLELCDRMGMLVQVEAFDCWESGKKTNDYHRFFKEWHEKDLRSLVRRDRNHPSVIMWSTGNEIREQVLPEKFHISERLTAIVKEEDPTRLVTAGASYGQASFNGFQKTVDLQGMNYKPWNYAKFRKENPNIPFYGSETSSCISSRGEYFFPVLEHQAKGQGGHFQVSSYDLYAPGWAYKPDHEFKAQDEVPACAGEYVWTGFDYLGEPIPYNQDRTSLLNFADPIERAKMEEKLKKLGKLEIPSRSSYFGIVDLCGFKKDRFYFYQSRWLPEKPMVHILPHWNWPERINKVTPIHIYTSGDEVELFLNGKSLGKKVKNRYEYRLRWDDVKYQPGELKAIAYKNGKKWAEKIVKTTGDATGITLTADRSVIDADGSDLSFITAKVVDKDGNLVPKTHNKLTFSIEGPGEIIATGNGDSTNHTSFQSKERKAFNGLCLVVVRSKAGEEGKVKLSVSSNNLSGNSIALDTR